MILDDTVFDSTNATSSDVMKAKDATLSPTDVFDNDSPNENKTFFDDESVVSDDGSIDTLIDNNDLNSSLNSSFRSEINGTEIKIIKRNKTFSPLLTATIGNVNNVNGDPSIGAVHSDWIVETAK